MNLSKSLKLLKKEVKVSDVFPITHLNTPTVFESQSGLMGSVIRLTGIPFETEEPETLNHHSALLHQAFVSLDSRFIVYVTTHRQKTACTLAGDFKPGFLSELNTRYHARFNNQALYTNTLYLTVVLKGDTSTKTASVLEWGKRVAGKRIQHREAHLVQLNEAVQQLCANLSPFGARLLGAHDDALCYSELIQFLSLAVNAGKSLPFQSSVYSAPIAHSIPDVFTTEGNYPQGRLSQYVSRYQLLFGDCIQFQGNTKEDVRFAAMLSLKKYPTATASILLDSLLSLDVEFISTHTFAPIGREASLKTIMQKRSKLISAEDKALSQMDALTDLEDGVASETTLLGIHHHTVMLIASSKAKLDVAIMEATKRYASSGIVVVNETLGLEPAFWSQIPCNHHLIARASLITSQNFVDFCPLHNLHTGFNGDNFLKSAVTLLETPCKTPVFFNYHSKGSATNPSKGHAAIFGGNNAGKTTLANFLDAQMGRFGGRSFYIDRDESSKIYILACGSSAYTVISPKHPIVMNPLQLPDTPENRSFLKSWLGLLIQEEKEPVLPSDLADIVNNCIDYAFEQLAPEFRTLSHVSCCLPVDFPRWPNLNRWLKGNKKRIDGDFHWLFDNAYDALAFNFDKVGFDVTYLMDQVSLLTATPVYAYLVHRMRQCLDGRLTSFVIDEAWSLFASPYWVKTLSEWLPTIRKKNGHFVFMTQSAKTVTTSAIHHVVLDNLATLVVFPNPMAHRDTYITQLNLTESQFLSIKENTPESRVFLYKQEQNAMLCKLDLSSLPDCIRVLSGNTRSVKLLDEIINEVGSSPDAWLPIFLKKSAS